MARTQSVDAAVPPPTLPPAYASLPAARATSDFRCSSVHSLCQVWRCGEGCCGPASLLPYFCTNWWHSRAEAPSLLLFRQVLRCCSGRAKDGLSSASTDALANGSSSEPQVRPNVATGPRVSNLYLPTCYIEPNSCFRKPNQALTSLASEATDGPFHKPPSRIDKLTTCRESSTLPHPLESPCPNTFCLGPGRTASLQLCQF